MHAKAESIYALYTNYQLSLRIRYTKELFIGQKDK
jgi:hypothetical protein